MQCLLHQAWFIWGNLRDDQFTSHIHITNLSKKHDFRSGYTSVSQIILSRESFSTGNALPSRQVAYSIIESLTYSWQGINLNQWCTLFICHRSLQSTKTTNRGKIAGNLYCTWYCTWYTESKFSIHISYSTGILVVQHDIGMEPKSCTAWYIYCPFTL